MLTQVCPKRSQTWKLKWNSPTPHTVCLMLTQAGPKRSPALQLKWNSPQHSVPHAYRSVSKQKPSFTAQVKLCASCLPRHVQREAKHDSSSGNSPTPQTVCLTLTQACPKRSQAWQLKWKQPHTTNCVPHAYPSMSKEKPSTTAQVETAPHHRLCASRLPKHVQREAKHDSSSGNSPTPHTVCLTLTQACPKRSQAWQLKWKQPHTTHCVPHAYPSMSKEKPSMTDQVETAP